MLPPLICLFVYVCLASAAKPVLPDVFAKIPPVYKKGARFHRKNDIAVVTFSDPRTEHFYKLSPITTPNKRAYCEANGYDFIDAFEHDDIRTDYLEHSQIHPYDAPHYYKLRLLAYVLRKHKYKWVLWSDTDALFLNFSKRLEPFLDGNYDFVFTTNPPGQSEWEKIINTGHFLVKNSEWSIKFLYRAYGQSFIDGWEYLEKKPPLNGWLHMCKGRGNCLWHDQRILQYYVSYVPHDHFGCHFKHVHFFSFNSEFPQYTPGDMVVHFPGRSNDERVKLMRAFLDNCDHQTGKVDWKKAPEIQPKPGKDTQHHSVEKFAAFNKPCAKGGN